MGNLIAPFIKLLYLIYGNSMSRGDIEKIMQCVWQRESIFSTQKNFQRHYMMLRCIFGINHFSFLRIWDLIFCPFWHNCALCLLGTVFRNHRFHIQMMIKIFEAEMFYVWDVHLVVFGKTKGMKRGLWSFGVMIVVFVSSGRKWTNHAWINSMLQFISNLL